MFLSRFVGQGFQEAGFGTADELSRQRIISHTPLKREGTPDDIARAVHFLIADAPYVTGETINVDGGRHVAL